jgi:hypothetical protein
MRKLALLAFSMLAVGPAYGQVVPIFPGAQMGGTPVKASDGTTVFLPATIPANVNSAYTLATNAVSSGTQTPVAGSYVLNLPAVFNGATITVTSTSNNGNASTVSYTALPAIAPRFDVYAGTTVSAAVTGGTPTGNTTLSGGPTNGAAGNQPISINAIPYTDRTVTLTAAQAGGTATIIAANPSRKAFAITPAADGRLYLNSGATGFYYPLYAGVTRSFSGQDCPTNAFYITGQTAGATLPIEEG